MFFLSSGIFLLCLIFLRIKNIFDFFYSSRPSRFIYYSVIWFCGFLLGNMKFNNLSVINLYLNFFSGFILINTLFLSSIILNNIHDKNIDRYNNKPNPLLQIINKKNYLKIFWICFFSSLLISISINITTFILTLIIHLTAYIYSCPPFRFKKLFLLNIILISLSSVLALFLGVASSNEFIILFDFPYKLGFAVFVVLSLAFNVKDINDYNGDKKYGVKTIMTVFDYEKGKKIIAILAFLGYVMLPVLLNSIILILYGFIFGTITMFTILKSGKKVNEPVLFLIFFIYLFVFILQRPSLF